MILNLYPWLINLYKEIILSNIFKRKNFGLIINYNTNLNVDNLVINIIKWLFCNYKINYKFCNKCINCNLLNNSNHPNYYCFDKNSNISLDMVKNINKIFFNNLYISKYKIIYFSNFNFSNKFINNFLLKIIEDSFYNVIIIFSCLSYIKIPNTILSRCYKYIIFSPNENYILNWILNNYKNIKLNFNKFKILSSIRISNFSPLLSVYLLEKLWLLRKNFINNINFIFYKNISKYVILFYNNHLLEYYINWFLYILLDILRFNKFKIIYYNIDYIYIIKYLSNLLSINKIFLIIDEIFLFLNDFKNNLNFNKNIFYYKLIYNIFYIINFLK